MAAPDDPISRPPSGVPHACDPPPEGSDGKAPLRRRIADRWNDLGVTGKASVIGSAAAAAVVGGFFALSNTRASATDPGPDSHDGTTDPREVRTDDHPGPAATGLALAAWLVDKYWRNTCLNPRGHATGDCTHELRPVSGHAKGPGRDRLGDHETANS